VAEHNSSELVALCASILDDGEVTSDEAYQLADWLNNHPGASEQWPGKELVKPLQEIWADGKVDKRELHRLARILISVQREWARHPRTETRHVSGGELPEFSQTNFGEVRLPSLSGRFRVPSQSVPGTFYNVDLSGPSCSCPDWRNRRSRLPVGDLTRCCKHVLAAYAKLPRTKGIDGWLLAFIENGWPAHPGATWRLVTVGSDQDLVCSASENGWANVFAKEDGEYLRFGFNVEEDRWAYGSEPHGAATIGEAIRLLSENPVRPRDARSFDQKDDEQLTGSRNAAIVWVAVAAIAILIVILVTRSVITQPKSRTQSNNSPPIVERREEPMPIARATSTIVLPTNPKTVKPSPLATQQGAWTTKTIRAVRAKTDHGDVMIPKDVQLRIVGRSDREVMVSYKGVTTTIPIAATDLK